MKSTPACTWFKQRYVHENNRFTPLHDHCARAKWSVKKNRPSFYLFNPLPLLFLCLVNGICSKNKQVLLHCPIKDTFFVTPLAFWQIYTCLCSYSVFDFFKLLYCPIGLSAIGNLGCFLQGKPAATVALPNLRCMVGVLVCPYPQNSWHGLQDL